MRLIDSRAVYLHKYLNSVTAKRLADWDAQKTLTDVGEIDVYCVLGWRDVTRALSAAKLIDSEIRRGARAVHDAYGSAYERGPLPASPSRFLFHLAEFPMPHHTNVSGLDIIEAVGPPMALRMRPSKDSHVVLAHATASIVGYAMAGFGRPFTIEQITGRNVRASDRYLAAIAGFAASGEPAFDVTGREEFVAEDLEKTYFQPVSSPPANEFGFEVHVVVQQVLNDHVQLIHARN